MGIATGPSPVRQTTPRRSWPRVARVPIAGEDRVGEVDLAPAGRPEVEAAGEVDEDGHVELALGDGVANVGDLRSAP